MRILFILENYLPHIGGVEIVFKNLSEGLVKQGHKVDIVTHQLKNTKKFEIINGVNVYRIPCFQSRYLFTFLAIPKALQLAKKADLIHTTTFNGAPPARLVSKLTKKKCVITVHEVWVGKWKELAGINPISALLHDLLERMIYMLKYDKYVAVSNSTRKQLLSIGINEKKVVTVHNGFDYDLFDPKKYNRNKRKELGIKKEFLLMSYGRPGVSKGIEYVIKAMPLIIKKIPNARLLLILSKDPAYIKRYNYMIDLIKKLNLQNQIIIKDPVPYKELPMYLAAADCVITPSLSEGFGYTVVEACSMQRPVVATNTTSIPEVIFGKHVLVEPKSAIAIAGGVIKIENKNYKITKKKWFTIEKNIKGYLKVYEEVLS